MFKLKLPRKNTRTRDIANKYVSDVNKNLAVTKLGFDYLILKGIMIIIVILLRSDFPQDA